MRIVRFAAMALALLALIAVSPTPSSAELKVGVSGYIKMDAAYQSHTNSGLFATFPDPSGVPFDEGPNKDQARSKNASTRLDVRQTRFRIIATDEAGQAKLRGVIELDFFGAPGGNSVVSNSGNPRVRHAYAQGELPYGGGSFTLLAGQYWSNFMNTDAGGFDTVDFNGPAGQLFNRAPQFRVTYGLPYGKDRLNISASVEPQAVLFGATDRTVATALAPTLQEGESVPTFTGKLVWLSSLFNAEVAGAWSKDKGISTVNGGGEDTDAWGVQGSVDVPIGPLTVFAHGQFLDGLNRLGNAEFADAVFRGTALEVATIRSQGGYAGARYKLTPDLSLAGMYGYASSDSSGRSGNGRGASAFTDVARAKSLHVTALQKFWGRFQAGLEFERQWTEAFKVNNGTQNITRLAVWYFF